MVMISYPDLTSMSPQNWGQRKLEEAASRAVRDKGKVRGVPRKPQGQRARSCFHHEPCGRKGSGVGCTIVGIILESSLGL